MFCGLFSIILSIKGDFTKASWLIIFGICFDGLDGLIAKTKNIQSKIGVELDSLANFITFCISPVVLLWKLVMFRYKTAGIVVCFIYVFFGAFRLAKFNLKVLIEKDLRQPTKGLPTLTAAGVIVAIVLLIGLSNNDVSVSRRYVTFLIAALPVIQNYLPTIVLWLALLMIADAKYSKLNNIKISQKVSLKLFSLILVLLLLLISYPELSVFVLFSVYVLYGLFEYLLRMYRIFRNRNENTKLKKTYS